MSVVFENVSKTFNIKNSRIEVIKDLSLSFPRGEISVIVGKSGCGKTTLLRLIAGMEVLTAGRIDARDKKIGYVFQEPRLFPWLTVKENIIFSDKTYYPERTAALLKMLGLYEFMDAYPAQISGGMAQRVALGRALHYDPEIILMDEPFASLDYFTRKSLQEDILKIQQKTKKTLILVTHDLDEALLLAEKIYVMKAGRIVETLHTARPDDILQIDAYKKQILSLI